MSRTAAERPIGSHSGELGSKRGRELRQHQDREAKADGGPPKTKEPDTVDGDERESALLEPAERGPARTPAQQTIEDLIRRMKRANNEKANTMRTLRALSLVFTVGVGAAAASDCAINNVVQTDSGPNSGVTGICSNNGEPIECTYAIDGSVACTGPEGTFNGDNLDALVMSACGCGE